MMGKYVRWILIGLLAWQAVVKLFDCASGRENGSARAATITRDWFLLDEPRDALMFGLGEKYLFEFGFESTHRRDRHGEKKGQYQTYGLSLALSRRMIWKTGPPTSEWSPVFSLGAGVGLLLEVQWKTERYDVVVAKVDYPSLETHSEVFVQGVGTIEWGPGVLGVHLRLLESGFDLSVGGGVKW